MHNIVTLSNGIRVVLENIEYVRSVTVGVWIGSGSAMETCENNGAAHFIEHMLFKGTTTRSAKDIAECMDRVGGQINAVTSKEYTAFYAKTLSEHLPLAVDLLSDMVINSTFTEENIETERRVIAEEINMCEDSPEDFIHDILSRTMWDKSPLGLPIAGTIQSLTKIDKKALLSYKESEYCGENMVLSVVGCFDETKTISLLEDKFGGIKSNGKREHVVCRANITSKIYIEKKDIEQCHICLGLEGLCGTDERIYDLLVANAVFGGNMSSRLFQKVREECGLAYSVYSYPNIYKHRGSLVTYAGLNPNSLCEALELIGQEIRTLKKHKLTKEEIETTKEQMKASVIMGLESMSSRMSSYGKSLLFENKVRSMDDTIKKINAVNYDTVAETIDRIFDINKLNIAVLGRVDKTKEEISNCIDF